MRLSRMESTMNIQNFPIISKFSVSKQVFSLPWSGRTPLETNYPDMDDYHGEMKFFGIDP